MSVIFNDNVAYIQGAQSTVYFASGKNNGFGDNVPGTAAPVKKITTALDVAPWGEDNRFPQNIVNLMDSYGFGKEILNWKMKALWGQGIIPVKVTGYKDDEGKVEQLEILNRTKYKEVYDFIEARWLFRFYLEFLQDWSWYGNCFPELVLDNAGKKITRLVHQESCDCRFQQMNEKGVWNRVYLSKLWGLAKDQFVRFNKEASIKGLMNITAPMEVDNKYMKTLRSLDMYNPLADLKQAADNELQNKKYKSVILPVNYPSPNKTYYQLANWDGARQAGWIDIGIKIPGLIKAAFNNAFHLKYHIEVPDRYFERRYGTDKWSSMSVDEKKKARYDLVNEMSSFLKGTDKTHASLITFFDVTDHTGLEYNRVKITELPNKGNFEKDLLTSASANSEFCYAAGVNPDVVGSSIPGGAYGGNKGGSNIREGKLVYDSQLHLERQVILEPLYLVRDFNEWGDDIHFRFRDTVLTTLDQGKGTEKVVS